MNRYFSFLLISDDAQQTIQKGVVLLTFKKQNLLYSNYFRLTAFYPPLG